MNLGPVTRRRHVRRTSTPPAHRTRPALRAGRYRTQQVNNRLRATPKTSPRIHPDRPNRYIRRQVQPGVALAGFQVLEWATDGLGVPPHAPLADHPARTPDHQDLPNGST